MRRVHCQPVPSLALFREETGTSQGTPCFWGFQSYVVIAVVGSSFFPVLFRFQEHTVVILAILCFGMCWLNSQNPWVSSPLDLPLGFFICGFCAPSRSPRMLLIASQSGGSLLPM